MSAKIAYTIKETMTALGLGRTTIYELIKQGELPYVKIGSRTLIRHSDLEAMLQRKVCNHDA